MEQSNLLMPGLKLVRCYRRSDLKDVLENVFENALVMDTKIQTLEQFERDLAFWIEARFISANPLQEETFNQDKVYIQKSGAICDLLGKECKEAMLNHQRTFIKGATGTGKSHAMLFYVLNQRREACHPIFYINNPRSLLIRWVPYVVNEVIYTISGYLKYNLDEIAHEVFNLEGEKNTLGAIKNIFSVILNNLDSGAILKIIQKLEAYFKTKGIYFLIVFDQFTQYQEECQNYQQAQELTERLLSCFSTQIYVMSNLEQTAIPTIDCEIWLGSKFSREEVIRYLQSKLKEVETNLEEEVKTLDLSDENSKKTLDKIEEATEFIPYQLEVITRLILKHPKDSLQEVVETCYSIRSENIKEIHRRWVSKLDIQDQAQLYRFILTLDNSLAKGKASLTSLISKPDSNLIQYDQEAQEWTYISPIAKEAIHRCYIDRFTYLHFISENLSKHTTHIVSLLQDQTTPRRVKEHLLRDLLNMLFGLQNIN